MLQYGEIQSELGRAPVGYQHQLAGRVSQYKESIASLRRQVNGGSSLREQLFSRQDEDPYQVCTLLRIFKCGYFHSLILQIIIAWYPRPKRWLFFV